MFADLVRLINRRPSSEYEDSFVESVTVSGRSPRNPRLERLFAVCWVIIILKCLAVVWLFNHYHIPINPLWVIAPTVIFAALCTAVYLLRD